MRARVDPLIVLGTLLFVAAVALGLAQSAAEPRARASGSVYDEGPGGTSVVRRLYDAAGIRTVTAESEDLVRDVDVTVIVGATELITAPQVRALQAYLERGGTLVLATDLGLSEVALLEALGVTGRGGAAIGELPVSHVALAAPPVRSIRVDRSMRLDVERGEPLVGGEAPVVVRVPVGRGAAIVVGALTPFLNATIGTADNGRFALALVAGARSVAFDEYHHGVRAEANAIALLTATWPGAALLAAGVVTFLYLLASGRRLGPAVPLDPRPPRSSLEHIRGVAALLRRSGHRRVVREHLRDELRRGLARRGNADPATAAAARELDARLAGPLRDEDVLRTVAEIDGLLRRA